MSVIAGKMFTDNLGIAQVLWSAITEADSGGAVSMPEWPFKTVQVYGDFTANGAITMQGSPDNSTWATLHNPLGTALVITDSTPQVIAENTLYIRPLATAGAAVAMNVLVTGAEQAQAGLATPDGLLLLSHTERTVDITKVGVANGDTLFTISGGSILLDELIGYCTVDNGGAASTLQFSSTPTLGSAKTLSAATAGGALTSLPAGGIVRLNPTSLATAPDVTTGANGGVALGANVANRIIVNAGIITAVVGTGPMTGTWEFHIRYTPMSRSVIVT